MDYSTVGEAVLPLVLRRCQLPWSTISRLLCTSKAAADVVHDSCAGSMELRLTFREAGLPRNIEHWMSKHAVLLHTLRHWEDADSTISVEEVAAALARAAALPSGLMLRELQSSSMSLVKAVQGSCSTLTCLNLRLSKEVLFPSAKEAAASITGLRHLSSLTLYADWILFDSTDGSAQYNDGQRSTKPGCGLHSLLAQCLPQLTALTRLAIDEVADTAILKHAPPQLVELEVVGCDDQSNSVLELGHLTACTNMELLRNCLNDQLGWRVVDAVATLPPNLRRLQVVDCTSATPLLALTQLTALTIAEHCNMPAAELKRLSSLTQLEHVHLRYQVCRRDVGEEAAQEGSAGWVYVPALKSLQLHMARIDPACDLLQHLAACTSLTRLVWEDSRFLTLGDLALRLELADDEFPEEFMTYMDGGLGALGAALPASLKEVEFEDFLPQPDDGPGGSDEGAIVLGLYHLRCAIDALPHLKYHRLRDDTVVVDMYSEAGVKLINMLMYVEGDFNEPEQAEAFFSAHAEAYPHHFSSSDADDDPDDCDDEGSSEAGEGSSEADDGSSEADDGSRDAEGGSREAEEVAGAD